MGLAERVVVREAKSEQRAIQVTPWGPWEGTYGTAAGVQVNQDSSLQLLTVYGCVQLIADTIACLPRDIYRTLPDSTKQEVAVKPRWFEQPSPSVDIIEFLTQTLSSLLLDGNAYWAYTVDLNFAPTQISVLDPLEMTVRPADPGSDDLSPIYTFRGVPFRGRLLHIKGLTRPGCLKGLSPVESARQSLGIGLAVQEFAGNFYKNGTTLSAIIEVPGAMTREDAKKMRENISRDHGGVGNAHLPGVITNGAKWNTISVTPEQAQFLESRQFQAAEICAQMFLMDPSMLGISSAGTRGQNLTYANLEDRGIHLVQYTLLRWIIRLERAFSSLLPKPQYMKFNVDALQRADFKTRYEAHRIALGPTQPFESVNEARELEELPPMPGFDDLTEPIVPPPPPAPAAPVVAEPQMHNHYLNVNVPQQAAPIVQPTFHVDAALPAEVNVIVQPSETRIDVSPTPVEIHSHIEVPEQAVPIVNLDVNPTPVTIDVAAPVVNLDVNPTPIVVEPAEVNVNIAAAENRIEVNPTPIEVHPPAVTVEAPNVTVEAAAVTVNQADITVEPAPVTVNPPSIRIDAPQIHIPAQKKIRRTFERDEQGITIAVVEEPIEPEEGTEQ